MILPFEMVFEDQTKLGTKVQTSEYRETGAHIIVDQGQEQVAGYTDREEGIFTAVPAIIFGDHTRIIKYVDQPFFLGADGVKVLRCKKAHANYRYLYYALRHAKIPDTGYNRHYKWLKAIDIEYPDASRQEEIVTILDGVCNIIAERQRQLRILDQLIKARFVEMFGDPEVNPKGWIIDSLGNYMTVLTDFSANGSYELLDSNVIMYDEPNYAIMVRTTDLESGNLEEGVKYIDQHAYELLGKSKLFGGELIMSKIGSAGKIYVMPKINRPASLGRNAFMFRFNELINMTYLFSLLTTKYGEKEIQQHVRGAVTKTITKDATRSIRIIVPPIILQEQFAAFVSQVDKSQLSIQASLDQLETLKQSLMQEYFI